MSAAAQQRYHDTLLWRLYDAAAQALDRRFGWHRLPTPLGILVLIGLRDILRKHNLDDTTSQPAVNTPPVGPLEPHHLTARSVDGTYNDLEQPAMGMAPASDATCPSTGPTRSPLPR